MEYRDELEIKRALGIDSWRNLSKDKMMRFAAMMPDMDAEVALKIIDQFPAFKDFAMNVVNSLQKAQDATLTENRKSQKKVHRAYQDIRDVLKGELNKDDLTPEDRKFLIEQIQETGRQEFLKDSENKKFLDGIYRRVLIGASGAVAASLIFVGAKVMADGRDSVDS